MKAKEVIGPIFEKISHVDVELVTSYHYIGTYNVLDCEIFVGGGYVLTTTNNNCGSRDDNIYIPPDAEVTIDDNAVIITVSKFKNPIRITFYTSEKIKLG
jgi:hypothetical protein